MPTIAELQDALVNADRAGDATAAKQLADAIVTMQQTQDAKPASVQAGEALSGLPRQLGLTARYALEGPAQFAEIVTEPARKLVVNPLLHAAGLGGVQSLSRGASDIASAIGLPSPVGANERVIGDASRLVAGAGAGGLAGGAMKAGSGVAQKLGEFLASNPTQSLTSAAGAGLAGGSVRESGGGPWTQAAAALAGGIAAPSAIGAIANAGRSVANIGKKVVDTLAPGAVSERSVDQQIALILRQQGVDWGQVSEAVKQSMRAEVSKALGTGGDLDPAAVRRLLDFKTIGATPTRGMLTLDPVQITREQNLAKTGANSLDPGLQSLSNLQNQNNTNFIGVLNGAGAGRGNLQSAGEAVNSAILGKQAALRGAEQSAWDAAKTSPGYRQPIASHPLSDVNRALGEEGLMPFLNPTISRYIEAFQMGQPFTPQAYRNLQSMLANEMSKGGNEAAAAGLARRVLESSELRPITPSLGNLPVPQGVASAMQRMDAQPQAAIDAVNQARAATRAAYAFEESSPLVRSVLSGGASSDPVRVAQRFVIGGTQNEARELVQQVWPQGIAPIRDAILAHLKDKALNGAADEVGKFSQSAYNKAIKDLGDQKLALFFSPEEIAKLQALGRVSSYAQVQPVGSAVNNSNSGALLVGRTLDAMQAVSGKLPLGLDTTINGVLRGVQQRQAMNVPKSLLAEPEKIPLPMLLGPTAIYSGLLASQPVNQR